MRLRDVFDGNSTCYLYSLYSCAILLWYCSLQQCFGHDFALIMGGVNKRR